MKLTNSLLKGLTFLLLLSICPLNLTSQTMCESNCQVQCQGQVNVSLDQDCMAEITPAMGGVGITYDCNDYYDLRLWDVYDNLIGDNIVDIRYNGQMLKYEITEPECGNKCWGYILAEYKLPPQIDCPPNLTVTCTALAVLDFPPATGGCADFEVGLLSEKRNVFDCHPLYTQTVTRTYFARDEFGNTDTCSHILTLERVDLDNIIFPPMYSVGTANAISCRDDVFEFDENGIPLPWPKDPLTGSGTGVPILCDPAITNGVFCPPSNDYSGTPLIPHGLYMGQTTIPTSQACNVAVIYTDIELPKIGCVRKIMRQWEVREWWCSGESSNGQLQLIEIIDDQAPEFDCPNDFTVTTNYDCAGSVLMPSVYAHDECGTVINYKIDYPNGLLQENGGYIDLELGTSTVEYIVSDDCYNSSNCYVDVTVEDHTNPVAICELYKVVSLGQSGETLVFAEPFDNGSWDECALDRFEVRRMDTTCVAADTLFGESVTFCCSDIGDEVMVVFRAWDKAQNYNDCMVRVEVQDKLIPDFDCPPDVTIDCHDIYDLNNLDLTFGELITYDNCAAAQVDEIVIDNVNQCGIGTIQRIFEYRDQFENVLKHCKQVITITNNTPFVGSNILWPLDYEVDGGCTIQDLSPENLPEPYGFPTFTAGDDECSLLGYDYEDKFFEAPPGSGECGKIERTWTVINWCGQREGIFDIWVSPVPQYIKLINTVAPEIEPQDDLVFESQNIDCINGDIVVERTATDDCQNVLFWTFVVRDINDYIVATGNTNFLVDTLPSGNYNVEWTVTDGCGNFDVDYQNIEVINTKAPSPVCISGLAANLVLMDLDSDGTFDAEMVELWAEDFDAKSYHTCSNPITLSLSSDINDISRIYDCDDIGINTVQLWVTDLITGAQAYCETFVDIQDNNGDNVCDSTDTQGRVVIQGDIYTELNDEIEGVEVGIGIPDLEVMTSDAGEYAFAAMPLGGSYQVIPHKDDEHLNGISTLDLILIQRHILGVEWLDSPYKMIAADVNGNQDISSVDLIELRKLILGVYNELPQNEAWRFVDAEYDFIDPLNPWIHSIPEDYMIQDLNENMNVDFIGIKVGDVNGSVVANSNDANIEDRDNDALKLTIDEQWIAAGEIANIQISTDNYTDILGWQTAFKYDASQLSVIELNAPFEGWSERNYHIDSENGVVTISYHSLDASSLNEAEVFLDILVETISNVNTTRAFALDQESFSIEAYTTNAQLIAIEIENAESVYDELKILGAQPNPFVEQTDITIEVPEEGNAIWQYYDVNGRLLYQSSAYYTKGTHTQSVARDDLNASGMVYVNLLMHNKSIQYRLILL